MSTHPKYQFPSNISICSKSLLYKPSEKCLSLPHQLFLHHSPLPTCLSILKFSEVSFCTYCKGLRCLKKIVIMLIFLCMCIKHSQQEIRKSNSKLSLTKNYWTSFFSCWQLKISKWSFSLAWLGDCTKTKVTPLLCIASSWLPIKIRFFSEPP